MACTVVMDLKPTETKFVFSKTKKSATIPCSFTGKHTPPARKGKQRRQAHTAGIELLVTSRSGGRRLRDTVPALEALIASGSLLRVTGTLHRLLYQDRDSGLEVDKLRVYAFDVSPSPEAEPIFSIAQMEGGVRKVSDTDIFKDTGDCRMAAFNLFASPDSGYDRESYLTVYVNGYNDAADKAERMKVKENSHVIASGRLEATGFGPLCLKLYGLGYAKRRKKEKE